MAQLARRGVHRGSLLAPVFFGDPLLYPSTHADAACHRHMDAAGCIGSRWHIFHPHLLKSSPKHIFSRIGHHSVEEYGCLPADRDRHFFLWIRRIHDRVDDILGLINWIGTRRTTGIVGGMLQNGVSAPMGLMVEMWMFSASFNRNS